MGGKQSQSIPLEADRSASTFWAAFVDADGSAIEVPNVGDRMPVTLDAIERINEAPEFLESIIGLHADFSKNFMFDGVFDIYPLIMHWLPKNGESALAIFQAFSLGASGMPVERAPCILWLATSDPSADEGSVNVIEGMFEIDDFSEVVARYPERPLALMVTALPPGSEPLSAAALTFAGAYFLRGIAERSAAKLEK